MKKNSKKIYPHTITKANAFGAKNRRSRSSFGVGVYLDYAATTPVDSRVQKAMLPFFSEKFGNTMSLHNFGQEAKVALEESREVIADFIGAEAGEIMY